MKKKFIIIACLSIVFFAFNLSGCLISSAFHAVVNQNTVELTKEFSDILIETQTATIDFRISDNGKNKVFCTELKGQEHKVEVFNNTLTIKQNVSKKWYDKLATHTKTYVVVYLTKLQYDSLEINGATSGVTIINGFTFTNVNIKLNKGNVTWRSEVLNNFNTQIGKGNLLIEGANLDKANVNITTGDLSINNQAFANSLYAHLDFGDVNLKNCSINGDLTAKVIKGDVISENFDAKTVFIDVTTGDISLEFLTPKIIEAHTSGFIDIENSETGGQCKLKTNEGSIKVLIMD